MIYTRRHYMTFLCFLGGETRIVWYPALSRVETLIYSRKNENKLHRPSLKKDRYNEQLVGPYASTEVGNKIRPISYYHERV